MREQCERWGRALPAGDQAVPGIRATPTSARSATATERTPAVAPAGAALRFAVGVTHAPSLKTLARLCANTVQRSGTRTPQCDAVLVCTPQTEGYAEGKGGLSDLLAVSHVAGERQSRTGNQVPSPPWSPFQIPQLPHARPSALAPSPCRLPLRLIFVSHSFKGISVLIGHNYPPGSKALPTMKLLPGPAGSSRL